MVLTLILHFLTFTELRLQNTDSDIISLLEQNQIKQNTESFPKQKDKV